MADPTTTNRGLAIPTRGSDVGTWDLPVNGNMAIIDTMVGGVTSISSTGGTVTLNASQVANGTISVSGALVSNLTIVFPAVQGWWSVENLTTNSSSFFVSIDPSGGTQSVCAPPGEIVDIQINGTVAKYRNLGRIGSLMEYAGTSVPNWILNCTIPPYLNCDGSTFSSGTYPVLAGLIGTTLPDSRGRTKVNLNQGTGRTTSSSGVNGDVNFSGGGADIVTLGASQIPTITSSGANTISVGISGNNVPFTSGSVSNLGNGGFSTQVPGTTTNWTTTTSFTGSNNITVASNNTSGQAHTNAQPSYVAGLTLIRAG